MPADRTTIRATVDELLSRLREGLIADPPIVAKPFREVIVGDVDGTEHPRPFVAVGFTRARPIGNTDGDKLWEVVSTVQVVTDALESDPHGQLLDCLAGVEDLLDSLLDGGVIEGADGFDQRTWSFDLPRTTAGARLAMATAAQTFVVKVAREQNRISS